MNGENTVIQYRLIALLLSFLVIANGCGYFMAGTWENDPKNWGRAFESRKPPDMIVLHSKYWRSPHWSYEFEYYFAIAPNARLKEQLFTENKLKQITGDKSKEIAKEKILYNVPAWFAPGDLTAYDVWVFAEEPDRNFIVLINKESGTLYLSDHQL